MEEQNKKLEAVMDVFKELSYEEKREKVISLVESLWENEIYQQTLEILRDFSPNEEYICNIYKSIIEVKLISYEEWKEQEKLNAQQKMQDYMHKLNELSMQQKIQDEKEADELLSSIE